MTDTDRLDEIAKTLKQSRCIPPVSSVTWIGWATLIVVVLWVSINIYWDRQAYIHLKNDVTRIDRAISKNLVQPADVLKQVVKTQDHIIEQIKQLDKHLTEHGLKE